MKPAPPLVWAVIWRTALFVLLWWVLSDGRLDSWTVGSGSVALATLLSLRLSPPTRGRVSFPGLLRFLTYFVFQSLRGGIQVAWFAMRPQTGLRPAMREIDLRLPEGIGRVLLINTLNLLPGTLSVELQGRQLCLHVLDEHVSAEAEVRMAETFLARMLRLELEPA